MFFSKRGGFPNLDIPTDCGSENKMKRVNADIKEASKHLRILFVLQESRQGRGLTTFLEKAILLVTKIFPTPPWVLDFSENCSNDTV